LSPQPISQIEALEEPVPPQSNTLTAFCAVAVETVLKNGDQPVNCSGEVQELP
jgi:hypothetical protein